MHSDSIRVNEYSPSMREAMMPTRVASASTSSIECVVITTARSRVKSASYSVS